MSDWTKVADRGLGYLGLFLIGTLSWLAAHIGTIEASGSAPGRQKPRATADGIDGVARSDSFAGHRVA
jgi:hypothetical protein